VIGSVELVDNATGRTRLVLEPNERGFLLPPPARHQH